MPAPVPRGGKKAKVSRLRGRRKRHGPNLEQPTDFSGSFIFQGGNVFAALIQDQSEEEEEEERHPPKPAEPEKSRIGEVREVAVPGTPTPRSTFPSRGGGALASCFSAHSSRPVLLTLSKSGF